MRKSSDEQLYQGKYKFYKESPHDKIYWVSVYDREGEFLVSFDRKTVFNIFSDYPWKFTPEQKALFDKENPYWASFFRDRNDIKPLTSDEDTMATLNG